MWLWVRGAWLPSITELQEAEVRSATQSRSVPHVPQISTFGDGRVIGSQRGRGTRWRPLHISHPPHSPQSHLWISLLNPPPTEEKVPPHPQPGGGGAPHNPVPQIIPHRSPHLWRGNIRAASLLTPRLCAASVSRSNNSVRAMRSNNSV